MFGILKNCEGRLFIWNLEKMNLLCDVLANGLLFLGGKNDTFLQFFLGLDQSELS